MQADDQGTVALFRPAYFDIFNDHLVALMFSQIVYWYQPNEKGQSKLRKYRDHQWWLVKSHVHWWEELRLTRKQSTRCLNVLKSMGLIETNNWMFDGHPTVHLRCTLISGRTLSKEQLGTLHCTLKNIPLLPEAQCITETTTETTAVDLATDVALPISINNGVGKIKPHQPLEGTEMATAEETLAKFKSKTPAAHTGKITPSSLGMRWKKLLGAEGGYVKELTGMQLGQLKQLHKALGDEAMGVMEYAVVNWGAFCWEAKAVKGLGSTPEKPDVGFLQKYHDVAVQLIAKKSAAPTVQSPAPVQSVPTPKPVVAKPVEPAAAKHTAEEVSDIFAALEALHPST